MLAQAQAMAAVAGKYTDAGWTVITMPKGCIVDFTMASGGLTPRIHHIQVVTPATEKSARFSPEAQNAFIQNAMSNSAAPVYATVIDGKVSCVDVNTRSRVIVTKQGKPAAPDGKKPAMKPAETKKPSVKAPTARPPTTRRD